MLLSEVSWDRIFEDPVSVHAEDILKILMHRFDARQKYSVLFYIYVCICIRIWRQNNVLRHWSKV